MRIPLIGLVVLAMATLWPSWVVAGSNSGERALARRIAGNLKNSGRVENYRVGVKVSEGTAWLLGTVANAEQEETAMEIAEMTPGVDHVVSKLSLSDAEEIAPPSEVSQVSHEGDEHGAHAHQEKVPESAVRPTSHNARQNAPLAYARLAGAMQPVHGMPLPAHGGAASGVAPASHDQPNMPGYSWPSYAAYPNYAAITYPRQYSPTAWPFIGPFYPYPQVPLGWRKVSLEWDDGWWQLDFKK